MDSADPRTQPAPQPQQQPHHNHHHPQQHHTQQQRQPQQPPNEQHHIQLSQQQPLHHQPQTTHPPQHAQQNQTGYAQSTHSYQYPMQLPHHTQPNYPRVAYPAAPYGTNVPFQYGYAHQFNQHASWPAQATFQRAAPVSTPPVQNLANTPKAAPPVREVRKLKIVDPKTHEEVDLTSPQKSEKSSSDATSNPTTASPIKPTTRQPKTTPAPSTVAANAAATKPETPTSATGAKANATPQTPTTNYAVPVNATITNNATSGRTGSPTPPPVYNILLQKVSEDVGLNNKRQESTPVATPTPPTAAAAVAAPAPTAAESSEATKPLPVAKPAVDQTTQPQDGPTSAPAEPVSSVSKVVADADEKKEKAEVVESKPVANNAEETEHDKSVNDKDVNDCDADSTKEDAEADGEINLHYEDGQYNPISNRNGKKKYSRTFMLDVCEKICKLDINKEVSSDSNMTMYTLDHTDKFLPSYQRDQMKFQSSNNSNRQNPNNYAGRSSAGQERQRKIIVPSSSLTNEVELKTVSNPWRPGNKVKEEEIPEDVAEVELLKKKFRSILNKLTPQNFDSLASAVTELHIDTEAKLGEVIDIVFAKALAEPGYCVLYGQMCSHLKKITAGAANFGNTLLKRCQNQFQADIYQGLNIQEREQKIEEEQDPEKKKLLEEELYEDKFRCRMRGLGLIKFIGELYKIEMLIDTIMFSCIERLLADPSSEESIECLCDLLKTIGEKLDKSSQANARDKQKGLKNTPKPINYKSAVVAPSPKAPEPIATLDPIFEQLHKIRKNKDLPLSIRIRFKLLDLCELREKDNWQSKSKDNNPKKLDEIKKDHLESERQKSMGPRKSQEGRRLGHGGGSSSQISSLGNESGPNRTNIHSSASSQSIRDHDHGEKTLRDNSEYHRQQEQHRTFASSILKSFRNNPAGNETTTSSTGSLRPTIFSSSKTDSLRPAWKTNQGNTATRDATESSAATKNSTNANAATSGGQ